MPIVASVKAAFAVVGPAWRRAPLSLAAASGALALAFLGRRHPQLTPFVPLFLALALAGALAAQARLFADGATSATLGRRMLRLLVVWLLMLTFLFIIGLLFFVVLLASGYAAASAGAGFVASDVATWTPAITGRGRVLLGVVFAVGALSLGWTHARISLAPPASIAQDRVVMLSGWPLTHKAGLAILAADLLVGAGPILLLWLVAAARTAAGPEASGLANLARGLVIGGLWLPLNIGLSTSLYARVVAAAVNRRR